MECHQSSTCKMAAGAASTDIDIVHHQTDAARLTPCDSNRHVCSGCNSSSQAFPDGFGALNRRPVRFIHSFEYHRAALSLCQRGDLPYLESRTERPIFAVISPEFESVIPCIKTLTNRFCSHSSIPRRSLSSRSMNVSGPSSPQTSQSIRCAMI